MAGEVLISLKISAGQAAALDKFAAKEGYKTGAYAKLLFEAAFAARIAQTRHIPSGDRELEACLKSVFAMAGQADAEAISAVLNISESLAADMLKGWKKALGAKAAA